MYDPPGPSLRIAQSTRAHFTPFYIGLKPKSPAFVIVLGLYLIEFEFDIKQMATKVQIIRNPRCPPKQEHRRILPKVYFNQLYIAQKSKIHALRLGWL